MRQSVLKIGEILQKLVWLAYLVEAIQYMNRYDIYFFESSDFFKNVFKVQSTHKLENILSNSFKYPIFNLNGHLSLNIQNKKLKSIIISLNPKVLNSDLIFQSC